MRPPVPEVTGQPLTTAGQPQILVTGCPGCGCTHRHLAFGERRAPCGCKYIVTTPREDQP
ncbi:hypothetical protein ABZT28_38275 [Streptomyces sp. NPDC005388]|uniref:hypothetical protein n=1 Tax=Streptomyces sp. NPDC005388 TaxID=3156717 RepID=UPI0033A0F745